MSRAADDHYREEKRRNEREQLVREARQRAEADKDRTQSAPLFPNDPQ